MIVESPELRGLVERLMATLERREGSTAANMFLRGAPTLYIGTDPNEWWSGPDFVDAYPQHVASWPPLHFTGLQVTAYCDGTVGWAAAHATAQWGDAPPTPVRFTFVLGLESGIWRVVQMHSSVGVPNVDWVGVELTASLEQLLASIEGRTRPAMPDGTVTLLFTDIEDSTPLAAALGDTDWAELVGSHLAGIRRVTDRHGGSVVKTLGDGAMVAFTSTREAVRAAIAIQKERSTDPRIADMAVRIGVHVGDAVAADHDFYGTTVNKAARIASAAIGGQIMVSEAVRVLLADEPEFRFGDPTTLRLKGLDGVHQVTPVVW